MATAILDHSGSLGQAGVPRAPLRRAVYIHVSDLTSSAYNIDHSRLERELERVKPDAPPASVRTDLPTELVDTSAKKRLQPPRGGSNLVVYVLRCVVLCCVVSGSFVVS